MAFSSTISAIGVYSLPSSTARARRGLGQRIAQRRVRVDEGGARQVQAHHLHQHLVGVGGAVEGAGAGAVVGGGLGVEQLVAADLALGVQLAHLALLRVGQPGGHRARGHEERRQVAEGQRADDQARHDLVADAQHQRGVEHVVRQGDGGRHGDDVAGEQRQLHARAALGDAVAHGRHAAGELGDAARLARRRLDLRREVARTAGAPRACRCRLDTIATFGLAARLQLVLVGAARRRSRGRSWRSRGRRGPGPAGRRRACGRGRRARVAALRSVETSGDVGDRRGGSCDLLVPGAAVALDQRDGRGGPPVPAG